MKILHKNGISYKPIFSSEKNIFSRNIYAIYHATFYKHCSLLHYVSYLKNVNFERNNILSSIRESFSMLLKLHITFKHYSIKGKLLKWQSESKLYKFHTLFLCWKANCKDLSIPHFVVKYLLVLVSQKFSYNMFFHYRF